MLEAVRQVKQALGPDAWIVARRNVRRGGWLRFWARPRVELIALEAAATDAPAARGVFDPALFELRRLAERVDQLSERLADTGRLAEEVLQMRHTVDELRARSAPHSAASPTPTRLARARIRPDGLRDATGSDSQER